MVKRQIVIIVLLTLLITGCQPSTNGLVTLHGTLLVTDPDNALPAHDNGIYLVPLPIDQMVISIPTIPTKNPIQAHVDNRTGEFVFTKIHPGKYIVMILTISQAQIPAHTENGSLAVVTVQESDSNKTIELNYLQVP